MSRCFPYRPPDYRKEEISKSLTTESIKIKELKKTDGSKRKNVINIPKLDDANDAGGKDFDKCTLILTEGDSAKAFTIASISVVGKDRYGVFPLKGKLLNVQEVSRKPILHNAEIKNIRKILGLKCGKHYDS